MLVVIFGAGASFDSDYWRKCEGEWCPVLTDKLFDPEKYRYPLRLYPQCAPIAPQLQRLQEGETLEGRLDQFQAEAEATYERGYVELAAVRFYLRYLAWRWSNDSAERTSFVTNYSSLLGRLNRWRQKSQQPICLITFNYDTILDDACRVSLGLRLDSIDAYTDNASGFQLLKLHGSWNWGRLVGDSEFSRRTGIDANDMIEAAPLLLRSLSEQFVLNSALPEDSSSLVYPWGGSKLPAFPAIALPLRGKASFECPKKQVDALQHAIWNMTGLLVIGWRAQEPHFLKEFAPRAGARIRGLIVTGSDEGASKVQARLEEAGIGAGFFRRGIGFRGFLATEDLEGFLA